MAAVSVATVLRLALDPVWSAGFPLILFYPAVMVSAFLGGFGPGMLTTVLCAAAADYFWMRPVHTLALDAPGDALGLFFFVVIGGLISGLNEAWRRAARDVAESERQQARLHAAEQAARLEAEAAEQRLRIALQAGGMGTWQWTVSTGEVNWSEGLEAIHGLSPGTFRGTFDAFEKEVHPDDRARVLESIGGAVDGRRDHHVEYRIVRPDGAVRWVEGRGQLFCDAQGRPSRMVGVCADITERKHSEQKFELAIEAAPAAVIIVDERGTILVVNELTEQLLGYTRQEIVGRSVERLVPLNLRDRHPDHRASFFRDLRRRPMGAGRELYARCKDGTEVPVEIGLAPFQTANGMLVMATVTDITDRKRAASLLEEAVRAREDFVSIASHELRNPVNALHLQLAGVLRALERDPASLTPAALQDRVGRASVQVGRLSRLIDNLLDVSRISAGSFLLEPEDVDLSVATRAAVDQFRDELKAGQVALRTPPAPVVGCWDPLRLEQIVTNLVSNAIKYGDGKPIEISLCTDDGLARLSVTDHGIGIDPEKRDRLFARFERAVSGVKYGGFGLGLWITRRIVEAMHGQISVESCPGGGSTFSVVLPRRPPATIS